MPAKAKPLLVSDAPSDTERVRDEGISDQQRMKPL